MQNLGGGEISCTMGNVQVANTGTKQQLDYNNYINLPDHSLLVS